MYNNPSLPLSLSPPPPLTNFPRRAILIIGGGFAGLAAAVDLAERGKRVLLLERRSFLGGRAYSFIDRVTGDTVDNGQHLMMGCYHHTLQFLDKIGALGKLKFQSNPQVNFLHESSKGVVRPAHFKCPYLPAPFHLLAGLAGLSTIGWREKIGAVRVGLALRQLNGNRAKLADITVRQWLTQLGQSERIQRRFWDVVALATLNESPELASADVFARVLDQAFLHTRRDSAMVISKVGLSDLYTEDARAFIESRGGEVRLNADVARIEFEGNKATGVTLRDGAQLEADVIISAAPYFALRRILATEVITTKESFRHLDQFKSAPIVSINLWYDNPVTDLEFVGLLDSRIEWVFNKNAIAAERKTADRERSGGKKRQHLALVISGAHEIAGEPKDELIKWAVPELERFFPASRGQEPAHTFVVREYDATVSHTVGTARIRPSQQTEFDNFFLAGDWTNTGLPATIEGAVWSGQECARLILNSVR